MRLQHFWVWKTSLRNCVLAYFRKWLFGIKKDIKKYQEFVYTCRHLHIYICRCVYNLPYTQLDLTYALLHQLNSIFKDFFFYYYFFFMELIIRKIKIFLYPQDVLCLLVAQAHLAQPEVPFCRAALQPPLPKFTPALLCHQWRVCHLLLLNSMALSTTQCSNLSTFLCKASHPSRVWSAYLKIQHGLNNE